MLLDQLLLQGYFGYNLQSTMQDGERLHRLCLNAGIKEAVEQLQQQLDEQTDALAASVELREQLTQQVTSFEQDLSGA